jgi:hypothetical protein
VEGHNDFDVSVFDRLAKHSEHRQNLHELLAVRSVRKPNPNGIFLKLGTDVSHLVDRNKLITLLGLETRLKVLILGETRSGDQNTKTHASLSDLTHRFITIVEKDDFHAPVGY